jgi:hypothetical protein
MRTADTGSIGDPNALDSLLSKALETVKDTGGAALFAFGNLGARSPTNRTNISVFCPDAAFTTST